MRRLRHSQGLPGLAFGRFIHARFLQLGLGWLIWVFSCHAWAASQHYLVLQTSPLAGFQHYAGATLFPLMQVGDPLQLKREPANPYDPLAVRVEWRGVQIGYAPRADNIDLARLMDRGTQVGGRILHLQKSRDPWKRVLMELYVVETDAR
jgi:hypothetical protein